MTRRIWSRCWLVGFCLLLAAGPAVAKDPPVVVARSTLAVLWMQSSAEYAANCEQTYNVALDKIRCRARQPHYNGSKSYAVIMDLDETVFDNSKYQVYLEDHGLKASNDGFAHWAAENVDTIDLVPGAKRFTDAARRMGVQIFFVSNRPEYIRKETIETLRRLGLPAEGVDDPTDKHLLLLGDKEQGDKRPRFGTIAAKHDVIAYVGDQLGDFPESFDLPKGAALAVRREFVERHKDHFGRDWFVLPNPVYGHWARILDPDPASYLQRGH